MKEYSKMLPEYPRTLHLPWKPNASRNDLIASEKEASVIFTSKYVEVTEKVDGANCGIMLFDEDVPLIRNRSHILSKGYNKATPAKAQFSSVWNWFYDNKEKFELLNELMGFSVGVYGEWLYALHGVKYDKLPSLFVPFDVYDHEREYFIDPAQGRKALQEVGFDIIPLLHEGPIESYEQLEAFCQEHSPFASERREGVYVKVSDGTKITKRLKMVRDDFIQGCHWSDKSITRNQLKK